MGDAPDRDLTSWLHAAATGDARAVDHLAPALYDELRRLAQSYLRQERAEHTLQATALVNEAYLRLVDQTRVQWQNRAHFLAVAATMMRRLLINHEESRRRLKRGGDRTRITLDAEQFGDNDAQLDLLALHDALERLAEIDSAQARVVEMRFFGGMSERDIAEVLGVSERTVRREWTMARAWLRRELEADAEPAP